MKVESFQALLAQVPSLTEGQLDELVQAVEQRGSKTKALRVLEGACGTPKCAHCASDRVVKNGHSRGLQRYRCQACSKTFNATTGTPLAGLHSKERFFQQGECLAKGMTVREGGGRPWRLGEHGIPPAPPFPAGRAGAPAPAAHRTLGGGRDLLQGVEERLPQDAAPLSRPGRQGHAQGGGTRPGAGARRPRPWHAPGRRPRADCDDRCPS